MLQNPETGRAGVMGGCSRLASHAQERRLMMDESSLYRRRLQAITEKRKVLEQIERKRRELEEKKLKLQQLKRKSLRDRWLMEGIASPSEESDPSSPLWQTQCQIQQLEDTLASLQSQVNSLETQESHPSPPNATAAPADASTEDSRIHFLPGTEMKDLPQIIKRDVQGNGGPQLAGTFVVDRSSSNYMRTNAMILTQEDIQQTVNPDSFAFGKETMNCVLSSQPVSNVSPAESSGQCPRLHKHVTAVRETDLLNSSVTPPGSSSTQERTESDAETLQLALQEDEIKLDYPPQPPPRCKQVLGSSLAAMLAPGKVLDGVKHTEHVLVIEDEVDIQVESSDGHGPGITATPMPAEVTGDTNSKASSSKETHLSAQASLNHLVLLEAASQQERALSVPQEQVTVTQKEKSLLSGPISTLKGQLIEHPEKTLAIQEENISLCEQMAKDQEQIASAQQETPVEHEQILTHLNQVPLLPEDTLPKDQEQILTHLNQVPLLPEDTLPKDQEQILTHLNQLPPLSDTLPKDQEQILTHLNQVPSLPEDTLPKDQEQILIHLNQVPSLPEDTLPKDQEQMLTHLNQVPSLPEDTLPKDQEQMLTYLNQVPSLPEDTLPKDQEQMLTYLNQVPSLPEDTLPKDQEQILTHLNQVPSLPEDTLPKDQEQILTHLNQVPSNPENTLPKEQEQILTHLNQVPSLPEDTLPKDQKQILTHLNQVPSNPENTLPKEQEQILTHLNQVPSLPEDTLPKDQKQILTHLNQVPSNPENTLPKDQEQILTHLIQVPSLSDTLLKDQEQIPPAQQELPLEQEQILTLQLPSLPKETMPIKSKGDLDPAFPIAKVSTRGLDPEQQPLLQEAGMPAAKQLRETQLSSLFPLKQSTRNTGTESYTTTSTNSAPASQDRSRVPGADGRGPKRKTCHCCLVM
ncbi:paralemmin-3 isoform X4 [Microcaecilia unicolor]|uniref:Paralemmin-3 isoform X4 n=1 Tax=Microcaecilia unicolor TaxID=1415580 RepID=A0A6P7XQ10_9AMPH|nr:paralemmin-3 isoform X4 [Microcaecilia unicolor]